LQIAPSGYRHHVHSSGTLHFVALAAIEDRSISPFAIQNALPKLGLSLPWAVAETATTTPWLSQSTLYKAELIRRRAPWKTRAAVELATLEWVSGFNHYRLLEPIGYIPPAEAEENYYQKLAQKAMVEV